MDNRGDEKAEKGTKRECSSGVVWVRACVCVFPWVALCTYVCVCVCVCVRASVGVLLRDIFNSVCQLLSSPSARDVRGKLGNISVHPSFQYIYTLTDAKMKQMCAHTHSHRQEQKLAVADLSHSAPVTSLKVRETITITYNRTSFGMGGKSCLLKLHTHNVNNFTEYSNSFSSV